MSLPVVIRPEVQQDRLDARDYYDQQKAGFGDKFVGEISLLIEKVSINPRLFEVTWREIRACRLRRLPYIYRVLEDRVEILAVLHGSRAPSIWKNRA